MSARTAAAESTRAHKSESANVALENENEGEHCLRWSLLCRCLGRLKFKFDAAAVILSRLVLPPKLPVMLMLPILLLRGTSSELQRLK